MMSSVLDDEDEAMMLGARARVRESCGAGRPVIRSWACLEQRVCGQAGVEKVGMNRKRLGDGRKRTYALAGRRKQPKAFGDSGGAFCSGTVTASCFGWREQLSKGEALLLLFTTVRGEAESGFLTVRTQAMPVLPNDRRDRRQ